MHSIKRKVVPLALLALSSIYSAGLYAEDRGQRSHDAHEHGVGELNIAIEGNSLHIELESPAMNLVGFEHQPRDKQQLAAVKQAVAQLKEGDKLFVTTAKARCSLQESEVETALLHQEEDDHDEKGKEHEEAHADFEATYRFECLKPAALDSITVQLFSLFPATEELEVQLLGENRQTALELTATNSRIEL